MMGTESEQLWRESSLEGEMPCFAGEKLLISRADFDIDYDAG